MNVVFRMCVTFVRCELPTHGVAQGQPSADDKPDAEDAATQVAAEGRYRAEQGKCRAGQGKADPVTER